MSTDTTTTADTLGLSRDHLTLVVLSEEYARGGLAPHHFRNGTSTFTEDDRTFYAVQHPRAEDAVLVVPTSDPRHAGMWMVDRSDVGGALSPDQMHNYRGWSVPREHLSRGLSESQAVAVAYGRPASADMSGGERSRLPIAEAYPVGSIWHHTNGGNAVVVSHDARQHNHLVVQQDDGRRNEWIRGALDLDSTTYVGQEASQEATTGPQAADEGPSETFTRDELDRLVREARDEERVRQTRAFDEWKERANAVAVQYAKDNELCGNFERCMADIGLMGREEWDESHKVTRYVTFRVEVQATPDEDAYDIRYRAADWLADQYASSIVDYATEVQDEDGDTLWDS